MKRPAQLSATFVKQIRRPGVFGDGRGGHGLALRVHATKSGRLSKSWTQRIRISGRTTTLGLGSFPVVSLAQARAKALECRRAVEQGKDPRAREIPTFAQATEEVIAIHRASWRPGGKSETQWRANFRDHVLPRIGDKRVDQVTTADVLRVLTPIWGVQQETARRTRQRISAVMRWAIAQGHRPDDPAGAAIGSALPKMGNRTQHYRAVAHRKVGAVLAEIRRGSPSAATLCLEFIVLTAVRQAEAFGATWDEIDLAERLWTIPPERMKMAREHRVPLSSRALEVLEEARTLGGGRGLVFPTPRGKPLVRTALWRVLKENEVAGSVHGFRSSFRDWCGETGVAQELAEMALAHAVRNQTEAAYARSDLLERRRRLMADWASYLAQGS